jgi:hypothetical protein
MIQRALLGRDERHAIGCTVGTARAVEGHRRPRVSEMFGHASLVQQFRPTRLLKIAHFQI